MLRIKEKQRHLTANILAQGFLDEPMWSFILPESQRLQTLIAMFEVFVDDGIERGKVLLAPAKGRSSGIQHL